MRGPRRRPPERATAGAVGDRALRRWPWVLALVLIAVGSMIGRGHLGERRDAVAHGAWEATTFAQSAHATVHALTTVGAAVPPDRWRQVVGPLLVERDRAARAQLILLRSLAGEDRRLDALAAELAAIERDMGAARLTPAAERRVLGRAVRLGRIAGALARDLQARRQAVSRTMAVSQAALLGIAIGLLLWLFRAFRRVLLREASAHAGHLRHLADHDALTGLGNRRKLEDDLPAAIAAADARHPLQVLICDLDGFKAYNDACGHAAGDVLLARVAGRIAAAAGMAGTAYRLGGDEFCVLWSGGTDLRPVLADAIAEPDGAPVTGSVGAALVPCETTDGDEALRLADARMYDAKGTAGSGGARIVARAA